MGWQSRAVRRHLLSDGETPLNDNDFWVLLQLGWGEEEVRKPWVGEARHKERPSPAMAAAVAPPCNFGTVAWSPVARVGQMVMEEDEEALKELTDERNGAER
jgi:hypothetical protein